MKRIAAVIFLAAAVVVSAPAGVGKSRLAYELM